MVWERDFPLFTVQTDAVIPDYLKLPIFCLDSQMNGGFAEELPLDTRATVRNLALLLGGPFHLNSEMSESD